MQVNTTVAVGDKNPTEDSESVQTHPLFGGWIGGEPDGAECTFDSQRDNRLSFLNTAVCQRNGVNREKEIESFLAHRVARLEMSDPNQFSAHFVIEQAAERYFNLINHEMLALDGMFTVDEFATILNTTCNPVWDWAPWMPVSGIVADDNGVCNLNELTVGSPMRILLEKLRKLSASQNVALVDSCERLWRDQGQGPLLRQTLERMNFTLACGEEGKRG